VAGIALSPEFIFAGLWGMPDQRGFGVFWVDHEALAAAYDMQGAFNRVALKLAPGADERAVIAACRRCWRPTARARCTAATTRPRTPCWTTRSRSSTCWARCCPAIFLGVAAFLLNVVVSRLVATQREQIAALKALGYANRAIAAHYLKLVP
jgi:putative ABC transport system permease protein